MKRLLFFLLLFPSLSFAQTKLGSGIALPWPIASGGTGQITQQAAIDALTVALGATNGYVWTTNGTNGSWQASASGFSNPMTTLGDLIMGGASGTPRRLAIGTNGQFLTLYPNGVPTWGITLGTSLAANTTGDGLVLIDTTAATSGNPRWSPRIRLTGFSYKTGVGSGSNESDWIVENQTISGSAGVLNINSGGLAFSNQYGGNGYNLLASLTSAGAFTATSFAANSSSVTAATYYTGLSLLDTLVTSAALTTAYSPSIILGGHGWCTTATAADSVRNWRITNVPVSGVSGGLSAGVLKFDFGNANIGYINQVTFNGNGSISIPSGGGYFVNSVSVLSGNTLGSGVTASSLTSLGSSVTSTNALAANTSGTGKLLTNSGAATSGNQRYSPRYEMDGKGWETTNSSSNLVQGWWELIPVQGATQPNALASLSMEVNSRAALQVLTIDTLSTLNLVNAKGALQIGGTNMLNTGNVATTLFLAAAGNGTTTTGANNTGIGSGALAALIGGTDNIAIGFNADHAGVGGSGNIAIGRQALLGGGSTGSANNVMIGYQAGSGGTPNDCVGIGYQVGQSMSSGTGNYVAIGYGALQALTSGIDDVVIGQEAGYNQTTSVGDVLIGPDAGFNSPVGENETFESGCDTITTGQGTAIRNVYFGSGHFSASGHIPASYAINGSCANTGTVLDTALASGSVSFYPGAPTIGANSGVGLLNFYSYAATGTRGNTAASAALQATIDSAGLLITHIQGTTAIGSATDDGTGITSASVSGSDLAGVVTLTAALNAGGGTATVTFGAAYRVAPIVMLTPSSSGAGLNCSGATMWVSSSTTNFVIHFNTTAAATGFTVNYHALGPTP